MTLTLLTERPVSPLRMEKWGLAKVPFTLHTAVGIDGARGLHGPVLITISYTEQTIPMLRVLSQRDEPYGVLVHGVVPSQHSQWRYWRNLVSRWMSDVRPADFLIGCGSVSTQHPLVGWRTKRYMAMAPDMERWLQPVKLPVTTQKPYIVFLDEAIDLPHPDYALSGRTPPDALDYGKQMERMLELWEARSQYPIVIAAHPCRPFVPARLFGRRTYFHRTCDLVKSASYVLCHSSTSMSYAVLSGIAGWALLPDCLQGRPEGANTLAMHDALQDYQTYRTRYLATPEAEQNGVTVAKALAHYLVEYT